MLDWGRLITAMITPMDDDGSVNIDECIKLAKFLEKNGSSAIVLSGTTGESPVLSADEKRELFTQVKKNVCIPIIANIGTNYTAASIQNIKDAEACGVDGMLAVVPYYNKPNPESQYRHFAALDDAATLPIMLYNVPGRVGVNMTAKTAARLSKLPHIAAIKEASGNIDQLSAMVRDCEKGFLVYSGDDSQTLPALAVGGYGVVSVASHVVGPEMHTMIESYVKGDVAAARDMHLRLLEIFSRLFMTTNPIPVKQAVNLIGIKAGAPRLPLAPADDEVTAALREELHKLGKI